MAHFAYHEPGLVVVTFPRAMRPEDMAPYVAAYTAAYARHRRFALLFDTRAMELASLLSPDAVEHVAGPKMQLVNAMKPRTARQVAGVVVLLHSPLLADFVQSRLVAGKQAAPFFIEKTPAAAAARAVGLAVLARGGTPAALRSPPGALVWGQLPPGAIFMVLVMRAVQFWGHFFKEALDNLGPRR